MGKRGVRFNTGYIEGGHYKEASVLTPGQKTGINLFSGPGSAQMLHNNTHPQRIPSPSSSGWLVSVLRVRESCRRVVNERETMGVTKILADYSGFAAGKEGLWERREQSSVQASERACA